MSNVTNQSKPDYRYEAAMWWFLHDRSSKYDALLHHMLVGASTSEFDEIWKKFRDLAIAQCGPPQQCGQCGCVYRFARLESQAQCTIWECPKCRRVVAAFGREAWKPLGTIGPRTAYSSHGDGHDERYDAIRDWIRDPDVDEEQLRLVIGMWFLEAKDFDGTWNTLAESAAEMFPPPETCKTCAQRSLRFWRPSGISKGAVWRCEHCGAKETVSDNWMKAEQILRDIGAGDEEIARIKDAAVADGVAPLDAVKHVLDFNKKHHARAALPPPDKCFKCGESEWDLESVSPNAKAAKWKCTYCGRTELITSAEPSSPKEQAREAIPKDVQREVWRRDSGKCQRCGSRENLEFDHIIPVIRGGSSTVRNIQLLCAICNGIKSDSEPGAF